MTHQTCLFINRRSSNGGVGRSTRGGWGRSCARPRWNCNQNKSQHLISSIVHIKTCLRTSLMLWHLFWHTQTDPQRKGRGRSLLIRQIPERDRYRFDHHMIKYKHMLKLRPYYVSAKLPGKAMSNTTSHLLIRQIYAIGGKLQCHQLELGIA